MIICILIIYLLLLELRISEHYKIQLVMGGMDLNFLTHSIVHVYTCWPVAQW